MNSSGDKYEAPGDTRSFEIIEGPLLLTLQACTAAIGRRPTSARLAAYSRAMSGAAPPSQARV